jgi:hypothetical protein
LHDAMKTKSMQSQREAKELRQGFRQQMATLRKVAPRF